jgi:hypothetical protein
LIPRNIRQVCRDAQKAEDVKQSENLVDSSLGLPEEIFLNIAASPVVPPETPAPMIPPATDNCQDVPEPPAKRPRDSVSETVHSNESNRQQRVIDSNTILFTVLIFFFLQGTLLPTLTSISALLFDGDGDSEAYLARVEALGRLLCFEEDQYIDLVLLTISDGVYQSWYAPNQPDVSPG